MLINIDIKIADGNGKLLHRFERSFDDNNSEVHGEYISDLGKSFEDFLSEYMSVSGRMIREKLLSEFRNTVIYPYNAEVYEDDMIQTVCNDVDFDETEMEYKIRIGNKKLYIGKIPFYHNKSSRTDINMQTDNLKQTDDIFKSSIKSSNQIKNYDQPLSELNRPFNPLVMRQEKSDIDTILNSAMMKAIEKYEANLCPIIEETQLVTIEP